MSRQIGRNGGVTGIIDIDGLPQLALAVKRWELATAAGVIVRRGRSLRNAQALRKATVNSTLTLHGVLPIKAGPLPPSFQDARGTLTLQIDAGKTAALTGEVTTWSTAYDHGKSNDVHVTVAVQASAPPVLTGFPAAATPPARTPSLQETDEGMSKVHDPHGLATAATQRVDIIGLDDSDAAEVTRIGQVVSQQTTPPIAGLKLQQVSLARTDDAGGVATLAWGLTDSKDAIENPQNIHDVDPRDLQTMKMLAVVFTTAAPPADPTLPTGLKLRSRRDTKLNDLKSLRLYTWAKRDTRDDLVLPETWTRTDPDGLETQAQTAALDGAPAGPPSGLVKVASTTRAVTDGHALTVDLHAVEGNKAKLAREGTSVDVDVAGLTTRKVTTVVGAAGALPAPAGLKDVGTRHFKLADGSVVVATEQGLETGKEALARENSWTLTDPSGLNTRALYTVVGSPGTLDEPAGLKDVGVKRYRLADGSIVVATERGLETAKEALAREGTHVVVDPAGPESRGMVTVVGGAGALPTPTGLKDVGVKHFKLADGSVVTATERGLETSVEKVAREGTVVTVDADGVATVRRATSVGAGELPTPLGLVDLETSYHVLPDGQLVTEVRQATESRLGALARERTSSFRSAQRPYEDKITGIVDHAGTAQELANSQWTTFQAEAFAYGLDVVKVGPGKAAVTKTYRNPGKLVTYETSGGLRTVPGRMGTTGIEVFVAASAQIDTTTSLVRLARLYTHAVARRFWIHRLLQGSTIPEQSALIGKTNAAEFLGLPAGTVYYIGLVGDAQIGLSASYPFEIKYAFLFDGNGIFDLMGFGEDQRTITTGSPPAAGSFAAVGDLPGFGLSAVVPTTGDFSVFLA